MAKVEKARLVKRASKVQQAAGSLRWPTEIIPRFERATHKLTSVACRPTEDAYRVAQSVLAEAFQYKREGITYGGANCDLAPRQ